MTVKVAVVDYGISNVASVLNSFSRIGADAESVSDYHLLSEYTHIVLPGVGSFAAGMSNLKRLDLINPLQDRVAHGIPLLGLCLGMQLLADEGDEFGPTSGLGLLSGRVIKIQPSGNDLLLPHVGWNEVAQCADSRLMIGLPSCPNFYFVHSYAYADCHADFVVGTTDYAGCQVAVVEKKNIFGAQFHPEKSQKTGLILLKNFVSISSLNL